MPFNPWRALRDLPHILLQWDSSTGMLGTWDNARAVITLHPAQTQRQRRCTLAHELVHAERGHDGPCSAVVEQAVHAEAARRLIALDALGEALAFCGEDAYALAEELWVDLDTLHARLNHLHPSERGYLLRRLSMREESA